MRVMILGTGGVGGYIGAKLIKDTPLEVTLVARGEHLEAILDRGLEVIDDNVSYKLKPKYATNNPSNLGIFDLIIVSVKSTNFIESMELIRENVDSNTTILPILNGVDWDKRIREYYPNAKVLNGCIYIISNILKSGVIKKRGKIFQLCLGGKDFDRAKEVAKIFKEANLRYKLSDNIDYEVWKKFLFISPMAGLTTLYNLSMDEVASKYSNELIALMGELKLIANKKGVNLDDELIFKTLEQMKKTPKGSKTSMQLDIEQGKSSEIETLIAYPLNEAKRLGVEVPNYNRVYDKLIEKLKRR